MTNPKFPKAVIKKIEDCWRTFDPHCDNVELFFSARRNIDPKRDPSYLKTCQYDKKKDPLCPIIRLGTIVEEAGADFDELTFEVRNKKWPSWYLSMVKCMCLLLGKIIKLKCQLSVIVIRCLYMLSKCFFKELLRSITWKSSCMVFGLNSALYETLCKNSRVTDYSFVIRGEKGMELGFERFGVSKRDCHCS